MRSKAKSRILALFVVAAVAAGGGQRLSASAPEFRVLMPFAFSQDEPSVQIGELERMKTEFGLDEFIFTGPGG